MGKVSAKSLRCISYGNTEIELTYVERKRTLPEIIEMLEKKLSADGKPVGHQGLDVISHNCVCPFHALPRRYEIAAALNRLRTAKVVRRSEANGQGGSRTKAVCT